MNRFTEGSHVRIDIPDTTDPNHDRYHRIEETIEQVRTVLEELAAEYADEMGVEYEALTVRNQRTRWGSCSPKQNLSFNWRLIMAPPEIAEYILVHELAHLREQNHTDRFWRIVRKQLPDYRERANCLEERSVELIFTNEGL